MKCFMQMKLDVDAGIKGVCALGVCMVLASCGTTKTTTMNVEEDGSVTKTVEVEHFPVAPKRERLIYDGAAPVTVIETEPESIDHEIDTTSGTHIRIPGLHVDSDGHGDTVHVRAPFLSINKNGPGDKIKIKAPFVRINTND